MNLQSKDNQNLRLDTFLSHARVCSRRGASVIISKKHVKVNNVIVIKVCKIGVNDKVEYFDGKKWIKLDRELLLPIVYALNKPTGYITSMQKESKARIVASLLPKNLSLSPIGRLDKDSSGLLLFTNNGDLNQKLSHPSSHVSKIYHALTKIKSNLDMESITNGLNKIRRGGVKLDDFKSKPCEIEIIGQRHDQLNLRITMHEGKYRQVRRMLGKYNFDVIALKRVAIGELDLQELDLEMGKGKILTPAQIEKLF